MWCLSHFTLLPSLFVPFEVANAVAWSFSICLWKILNIQQAYHLSFTAPFQPWVSLTCKRVALSMLFLSFPLLLSLLVPSGRADVVDRSFSDLLGKDQWHLSSFTNSSLLHLFKPWILFTCKRIVIPWVFCLSHSHSSYLYLYLQGEQKLLTGHFQVCLGKINDIYQEA
jgi:hypothetical protein